jgi:hypothetical protein
MNAMHDAGFSDWEVKRVLGKEVPVSDATYLHGLSRTVTEKFPKAYEFIKLIGYANKNHAHIEELQDRIVQLEDIARRLEVQNKVLIQIISAKDIVESMRELRKKGTISLEDIELMKKSMKAQGRETLEEIT